MEAVELRPLGSGASCGGRSEGGAQCVAPTAVAVECTAQLTLFLGGTRYCHRVGRHHRSNGVFWRVALAGGPGVAWQECLDPECRGFRSPDFPIPEGVLPVQVPQGFAVAAVAPAAQQQQQGGEAGAK